MSESRASGRSVRGARFPSCRIIVDGSYRKFSFSYRFDCVTIIKKMLRTNDRENGQSSLHNAPQPGGAEPWGELTLMSAKVKDTPESISLTEDKVIIHRKDFGSHNTFVSRNHATIQRLADSRYRLTDHSANGTAINGIRIKEEELK